MAPRKQAIELIREFKGDSYAFGFEQLDRVGPYAATFGKSALLIAMEEPRLGPAVAKVQDSLAEAGVSLTRDNLVRGAQPNAPLDDVYRLETYILHDRPECLVGIGGGSQIDAVKAANVLATLGSRDAEIESYFGTNKVSEAIAATGSRLLPMVAVQTAASSAAHLTKYSNITDPVAGQKKLIVDKKHELTAGIQ